MVVLMFWPAALCTEAAKTSVPPTTREELLVGIRLTLPGKMGPLPLVVLPQPLMLHIQRIATANRKAFECDLPMHPSFKRYPNPRCDMEQHEPSNELENL